MKFFHFHSFFNLFIGIQTRMSMKSSLLCESETNGANCNENRWTISFLPFRLSFTFSFAKRTRLRGVRVSESRLFFDELHFQCVYEEGDDREWVAINENLAFLYFKNIFKINFKKFQIIPSATPCDTKIISIFCWALDDITRVRLWRWQHQK